MSFNGPLALLLALLTLSVLACARTQSTQPSSISSVSPVGQLLVGQTRQRLLSCAGHPIQERRHGETLLFRYYREAPMFEESFVGSKGSKAGLHHGCWATVSVEGEQVTGVEYRSVPEWVGHYDHCEEIFLPCVQ
jgi:hypothetical protein